MTVIFWIREGQERDCGGVPMVFTPLYAPAKAKLAVEVKNAEQMGAAFEAFWNQNKDVCAVPSPHIEAGIGRKIARYDDAKRYCMAVVNMSRQQASR
jgi:hypothetical protein